MERSVIRDRLTPDYAALHPGYKALSETAQRPMSPENFTPGHAENPSVNGLLLQRVLWDLGIYKGPRAVPARGIETSSLRKGYVFDAPSL
jgi:hypothetical protein